MYVIYSRNEIVFKSDTSVQQNLVFNALCPEYIQSLNVLKDSLSLAKYGGMAKNGVIEIYLNDAKYPSLYKYFKSNSATGK